MLDHPIEILLFEDNPNDAELTIRALRKSHLTNSIVHVRDGVDGIDRVESRVLLAAAESIHS